MKVSWDNESSLQKVFKVGENVVRILENFQSVEIDAISLDFEGQFDLN